MALTPSTCPNMHRPFPLQGVDLATRALAESSDQVRILRRVSGVEAPKDMQQAVITATVDFFTQCGGRKG